MSPRVERRRLYVDTSAYLAILLRDERSIEIVRELQDARLLSSVLLILEARRNLVRLARQRTLDDRQFSESASRVEFDIERFDLLDLTMDLCGVGPVPPVATPRSLDLIHLRTAVRFHAETPIDRFVTLDQRQEQAARELGLPV